MFVCRLDGRHQPYTRMTQRGKFVNARAQSYLSSQTRLQWQLKEASPEPIYPAGVLIQVAVLYNWVSHRMDLSNLLKAVEDACNGIIWDDDRWVDGIVAVRRKMGGPPHVILIVSAVDEGPIHTVVEEFLRGE